MSIEDEAKAAVGWVENHLPGHHQAPAPAAATAVSSPPQPEEPPVTLLATIHADLSRAGSAIEHAWPILNSLATNPLLDELVEAGLTAAGAGVEAAAFAAATDALKGAAARKAGAVDQVAAAVDAGQQAAQQAQPVTPSFTPAADNGTTAQHPAVV